MILGAQGSQVMGSEFCMFCLLSTPVLSYSLFPSHATELLPRSKVQQSGIKMLAYAFLLSERLEPCPGMFKCGLCNGILCQRCCECYVNYQGASADAI